MNFNHDLAEFSREELKNIENIQVPTEWDDYQCCIKYVEMKERWFDVIRPQKVVYAAGLKEKIASLSLSDQKAIKDIEDRLKKGLSIRDYMSKGIKKTDTKDSDFLLKNWGIYHLHLEKVPAQGPFTKSNLLFFYGKQDVVYFIDVKSHPRGDGWFDRNLLEIMHTNWPELLIYLEGRKVDDPVPDENIHTLLKNNVGIINFKNGVLFPTNGGTSTSGSSNYAVRIINDIFNQFTKWQKWLKENEEEIRKTIYEEIGMQIVEPLDYNLIIENGFFAAQEIHSNAKILMFQV